jgi:hypothetical protein
MLRPQLLAERAGWLMKQNRVFVLVCLHNFLPSSTIDIVIFSSLLLSLINGSKTAQAISYPAIFESLSRWYALLHPKPRNACT